MAKLAFWFTTEAVPTLEKTLFCHTALEAEARAVRGKTAGAYQGFNTFQWTPAVQSMAVLILRTSALAQGPGGAEAILEGHKDSLASSLDYSIGKAPCWILDVFGVDKAGNPLAKRLFRRTNPERKRKGPVAVAINEQMLSRTDINIFIDGRAARDPELLKRMADEIEAAFYSTRKKIGHETEKSRAVAVRFSPESHPVTARVQTASNFDIEVCCPACGHALTMAVSPKVQQQSAWNEKTEASAA